MDAAGNLYGTTELGGGQIRAAATAAASFINWALVGRKQFFTPFLAERTEGIRNREW
jgi:hypothetical protein